MLCVFFFHLLLSLALTQCFAFASSLVQVPSCVWIYLCAYMWQLYQCRCQCHGLHFSCYYACSCHLFNFIYIAPFLLPCMVYTFRSTLFRLLLFSQSVVRSVRCFLQLLFFVYHSSFLCFASTHTCLTLSVLLPQLYYTHFIIFFSFLATLLFSVSFTFHIELSICI